MPYATHMQGNQPWHRAQWVSPELSILPDRTARALQMLHRFLPKKGKGQTPQEIRVFSMPLGIRHGYQVRWIEACQTAG